MDGEFRHKGWHSRGYLPHLDVAGEIQALTFRLADALPVKLVSAWKKELERNPAGDLELRNKIARYEDAGHGCCLLREPGNAVIVRAALLHFDGERYRLLEWCVMPNHVHMLMNAAPAFRWGRSSGRGRRSPREESTNARGRAVNCGRWIILIATSATSIIWRTRGHTSGIIR